jgi:hypothetical protein
MTSTTPAIVCLGYNRPASLGRLLQSLTMARYPDTGVALVISLDHSGDAECQRLAERFAWSHGPKRVLTRPMRAGLRQHVLECGDLSEEYGAIIMLEDDIVVAPGFHRYATAALRFYEHAADVAGVALYSHRLSFASNLPFVPLPTEYDAFFLQFPASWGQAWTAAQWKGFRRWLADAGDKQIHPDLPEQVRLWPESSWVKLFASYCRYEGKTWVYPYDSYTTNFADAGFHVREASNVYQVPLTLECGGEPRFPRPFATPADYDPHFENRSAFVAEAVGIDPADFECDLYGVKPLGPARKRYLATTRPSRSSIITTQMIYKPLELNLLYRPEGDDIRVTEAAAVHGSPPPLDWRRFIYFSPNRTGVKRFAQIAGERFIRRIFSR